MDLPMGREKIRDTLSIHNHEAASSALNGQSVCRFPSWCAYAPNVHRDTSVSRVVVLPGEITPPPPPPPPFQTTANYALRYGLRSYLPESEKQSLKSQKVSI